jgi:hypothetical protein
MKERREHITILLFCQEQAHRQGRACREIASADVEERGSAGARLAREPGAAVYLLYRVIVLRL